MTVTINGSGTIGGIVAGGLPDGVVQPADLTTGAPSWDSSGNLSFNSGYGSVATAYGCRAWVNFDGTGTVAIRASGNVSSITDNGTGDYTVNLSSAMTDANYSIVGSSGGQSSTSSGAVYLYDQATARTTTAFRLLIITTVGNGVDTPQINVAIFR